jgi:hypothetical protein
VFGVQVEPQSNTGRSSTLGEIPRLENGKGGVDVSHEHEAVRVCPYDIVEGVCLDCRKLFRGEIGLRFIETPEGPGVEVCVCTDGVAHAIARVQKELIPTVEVGELG